MYIVFKILLEIILNFSKISLNAEGEMMIFLLGLIILCLVMFFLILYLVLKNNETYISAYELESLPAIKFKDSIIHNINEESIKTIVDKFNNFIDSLPSIKSNDTFEEKPSIEEDSEKSEEEIIDNENKTTPNQILVDTIKISDKEKLSSYIKDFAEKHKN